MGKAFKKGFFKKGFFFFFLKKAFLKKRRLIHYITLNKRNFLSSRLMEKLLLINLWCLLNSSFGGLNITTRKNKKNLCVGDGKLRQKAIERQS